MLGLKLKKNRSDRFYRQPTFLFIVRLCQIFFSLRIKILKAFRCCFISLFVAHSVSSKLEVGDDNNLIILPSSSQSTF